MDRDKMDDETLVGVEDQKYEKERTLRGNFMAMGNDNQKFSLSQSVQKPGKAKKGQGSVRPGS